MHNQIIKKCNLKIFSLKLITKFEYKKINLTERNNTINKILLLNNHIPDIHGREMIVNFFEIKKLYPLPFIIIS